MIIIMNIHDITKSIFRLTSNINKIFPKQNMIYAIDLRL